LTLYRITGNTKKETGNRGPVWSRVCVLPDSGRATGEKTAVGSSEDCPWMIVEKDVGEEFARLGEVLAGGGT